jgi:acetylornithine deacetylase
VQGGNWPGSVAESLVFEGRIGVIIGESIEEARSHLEKTIEEMASADPWLRENPPSVEWRGYQFEPASVSIDNPVVTTLSGAFDAATGEPPIVEGMTYASDMRHLINVADTPTLLFGPGDVRRAHGPDEYVPVEELVAAARTLALTALRFCGYEEP